MRSIFVRKRFRKQRGFTLVELLVVVGIIAVLIAILMPSLNKARKASRSLVCISNLRMINTAFIMYCNEHKGFTMSNCYNGGTEQYWWQALQPYWGVKREITVAIGRGDDDPEVRKSMRVILCPAAEVIAATPVAGNGGYTATAFTSWRHKSGGYGSYCFNMWLLPYGVYGPWGDPFYNPPMTPVTDPRVGGSLYSSLTIDKFFMKFSQAKGDTPTVSDGTWVGSWAENTDFGTTGTITPKMDLIFGSNTYDGTGYFLARHAVNRHNGAINVGFADGSARRVMLADLFKLYWCRNSKPRGGSYMVAAN